MTFNGCEGDTSAASIAKNLGESSFAIRKSSEPMTHALPLLAPVVLSAGETAAKEVRNALLARFPPAPLLKVRRFLYDLKIKGKAEFLT